MKAQKHTKLYEYQQKIKQGNAECSECGKKDLLTVDHIIPVSILEPLYLDSERYDLIYNDEDNFQILCRYHNAKKRNNLDIRNPKTIPLLKRLLNKLEYDTKTNCP